MMTAEREAIDDPTAGFADDPRYFFDTVSGKWQYEADDGTELEYDTVARAWVPLVEEDLLKAQQAAYSVAGVDEEAPAAPVLKRHKKRKDVDYTSSTIPSDAGPSIKRRKGDSGTAHNGEGSSSTAKLTQSKNTAVFVSGLPPDTTFEEMVARFKPFGVLMEDDDEQPRVKLYAKEDGSFSGEALVVYFKEESVDLAIRMLDEAELRLGDAGTVMRVKRGEFNHKTTNGEGGERATVKRTIDKKRATARITKLNNKLADWDSSDEDGTAERQRKAALVKIRTVVLKHMFTLKDLEQDPTLLLDLKEDVREECETLGEVTNVVLYDKEEDGIMTIKFKEPLSAQACVIKMNGRFFDGRRVEASLYEGKSKYKKSSSGADHEGDDEHGGDEDEKKRLDAFASWLEKDELQENKA
ncbi:uncharacterized protein EI90DRAFT_2186841 [Cantharellus anzutake]|uniref:uncharacterized protein n=1 Tax=Cantharellus anzutake TaxID=1750568 RepID=UPI001904E4F7|nr:uncharacterized protein EI90DRAFT_2186841 [Cantharellus anzutake]KAF8325274.1 hypothetical protein EI90DRAFT_2186841 [Cantharellus anzutake]